jgi:hypothetical protein
MFFEGKTLKLNFSEMGQLQQMHGGACLRMGQIQQIYGGACLRIAVQEDSENVSENSQNFV